MKKALVMIEAGQFSNKQISQLDTVVKQTYQQHVSADALTVVWTEIAAKLRGGQLRFSPDL